MAVTSQVEVRRRQITDAIVAAFLENDGLPPWRVHAYPPSQVVSPCVWVDMPALRVEPPHMIAEFPVVLQLDGDDQAQVLAFDLVTAVVWDAIQVVDDTAPVSAATLAADVGGPRARRYVITATSVLAGQVLCQQASALSLSTP